MLTAPSIAFPPFFIYYKTVWGAGQLNNVPVFLISMVGFLTQFWSVRHRWVGVCWGFLEKPLPSWQTGKDAIGTTLSLSACLEPRPAGWHLRCRLGHIKQYTNMLPRQNASDDIVESLPQPWTAYIWAVYYVRKVTGFSVTCSWHWSFVLATEHLNACVFGGFPALQVSVKGKDHFLVPVGAENARHTFKASLVASTQACDPGATISLRTATTECWDTAAAHVRAPKCWRVVAILNITLMSLRHYIILKHG